MSIGVNKVIIAGNVGKDADLRYTQSGKAVANFSVAVNETFKNRNGEKEQRVEWFRCVTWQRIAEVVGEYVTRGRPILVEGRLQTRTWTDREEIERTTFEVVVRSLHLLDRAPNGEERLGSAGRTENEIPEGEETPY